MTLVLMEGFDHFTDDGAAKGWTHLDSGHGAGSTTDTVAPGRLGAGRYGRSSTTATGSQSGARWRKTLPSATTKFVWGCAFNLFNSTAITDAQVLGVAVAADNANVPATTWILKVRYNVGSGQMEFVDNAGTVVAIPFAVILGSWNYIEIKAFINGASSTIEIRINGGPCLATTTCNLGSTAAGAIWIQAWKGSTVPTTANAVWVDDMYVVDCNTGSAPTNDFLGDSAISTIVPTGAGATTNWTPNTGANYAAVDEIGPDGDTTYVESSTVGHVDTYVMDDVVSSPDLYAVQFNLNAKKTDAGTRQIAPVVRQSSTDYVGATQTLSTSYVDYTQIMETNPATSAAWTSTQVNNDEFGVKVIA